jgi:glutamine amidotransferase
MITILNYGSGNLKSIKNGFSKIGQDAIISDDIYQIEKADTLILPGVGAFGNAMDQLQKYKDLILEHISSGKPFLGVCLGQQILFTKSEESKGIKGLDVLKGEVVRFDEGLKIPHMGWNNLEIKNECVLFEGIGNEYMYFVHSYYVKPEDENIVAATTNYGVDFPAAICKDNIFATQFHPEKSGEIGLKILKNFVNHI